MPFMVAFFDLFSTIFICTLISFINYFQIMP